MLHAPKNSKPFTTAILKPLGSKGRGRPQDERPDHRSQASRGDQGKMKLRITLVDDTLYPLISQFFLQHIGGIPTLHLGRSAMVISKVSVTSESGEPWAGFAGFETLLAQSSETETAWRLRVATSTAFKSGDADLPLPIPRLCFQSWLNSWDEHAPVPFFS